MAGALLYLRHLPSAEYGFAHINTVMAIGAVLAFSFLSAVGVAKAVSVMAVIRK